MTDRTSLAAAAAAARDGSFVVNNAGLSLGENLVDGDYDASAPSSRPTCSERSTWCAPSPPVLAANGGGVVLNVLSNLSWMAFDGNNSYAVAKAGHWSLTNGIRLELAAQGTQVTGLVFGPTATSTMKAFDPDAEMSVPIDIVRAALDGVEAGVPEVLADAYAAEAKAVLAGAPRGFTLARG